jgi:hypothetical protein
LFDRGKYFSNDIEGSLAVSLKKRYLHKFWKDTERRADFRASHEQMFHSSQGARFMVEPVFCDTFLFSVVAV